MPKGRAGSLVFPSLDGSPLPTWQITREVMAQSLRSPQWRAAGEWALDVLERELGTDWPAEAFDKFGALPLPLILASGHTVAFTEIMELALRVDLVGHLPGFADARNEVRGDRRVERAQHFSLQMEIAGLASRCGWDLSLEPGTPVPADIMIDADQGQLVVELKVLRPSAQAISNGAQIDKAFTLLREAAFGADVCVGGRMETVPNDTGIEAATEWIRTNAACARGGGAVPDFADHGMRLTLRQHDRPIGLRGPTEAEDALRRLLAGIVGKADRMQASGAEWLRVDALTGIWAFTAWGCSPMRQKMPMLAEAIRNMFDGAPPIAGVIVCSGASLFPGQVNEEHCELDDGSIGLRYAIAPMRAREAIIIPLREDGIHTARSWVQMHESEQDWLAWALAKAGLPRRSRTLCVAGRFDSALLRDPRAGPPPLASLSIHRSCLYFCAAPKYAVERC